ncbi:hypothetical protein A3A49_01845 [Candidatus Curtissbacteria bacterium RIFCSPLOWO2_01_FULL_38_11b]|uniref:GGDEF domain-containing protein n=1 Tax=Candidatus Curtissbacteria bacterium RIFCSPLOWO2_01_FULL_38_11b TaxID=1797725 RepID=A0A1F5H1M1_9BACT|nr:MAG: hypothetical protein A3A49_01845 [Candidatus Curtissbacteria bacterium RIFCSPLOWO2_01_FULL_38_11b]
MDSESSFVTKQKEIQAARQKLEEHRDFLSTLSKRVERRLITPEERDEIIAITLLRKVGSIEQAQRKALTDALTQLPNKKAFEEAYQEQINSEKLFGLLIADIDRFKVFNDTYGHLVGDNILTQVALLLKSSVREHGTNRDNQDVVAKIGKIGRIGGEEFAMLLPGVSNVEDLRNIAERIRMSICVNPLQVSSEGKEVQLPVTISIGGSIYTGENPDEFFERVDKKALYEAKREGRNKVVILMPKQTPQQEAA